MFLGMTDSQIVALCAWVDPHHCGFHDDKFILKARHHFIRKTGKYPEDVFGKDTFQPTSHLRYVDWLDHPCRIILEQEWVDALGNAEWRAVKKDDE